MRKWVVDIRKLSITCILVFMGYLLLLLLIQQWLSLFTQCHIVLIIEAVILFMTASRRYFPSFFDYAHRVNMDSRLVWCTQGEHGLGWNDAHRMNIHSMQNLSMSISYPYNIFYLLWYLKFKMSVDCRYKTYNTTQLCCSSELLHIAEYT